MTEQTTIIDTMGISTEEVGTITGDVAITTLTHDGTTEVHVAYEGAKDIYTVTGSPLDGEIPHDDVVGSLDTEPSRDQHGNIIAHTLNA